MLPAPVRDFLDTLSSLTLADWRRVTACWANLDPRSYDTADRSMVFAIQARQMAGGSSATASTEVMELDAEIVRIVNAMRFLARDGERVAQTEVDAMRAAAVAAGFAILARREINDAEFRTLLAPFQPWIAE